MGMEAAQGQRLRRCLARRRIAQPLAGGLQAQELLQLLLAACHRLPQQQVGWITAFLRLLRQLHGQQRAGAHSP